MNLIAKLLMNSLYGRFSMKDIQTVNIFVNKYELNNLNLDLISSIKLNDDLYFIEANIDDSKHFEVNVGISSAITAYSRIHMQRIKRYCQENNIKIYYFDTDSLFTDQPLPDYMVGKDLGLFKLEYIFKEVVFLGPKIYAGITINDNYICKIKGFKEAQSVPFNDMKSLLIEGSSFNLNHNKWFRDLGKGNIIIKDSLYKLTPTQNKRKLIYEGGIAIDSHPYKINTLC